MVPKNIDFGHYVPGPAPWASNYTGDQASLYKWLKLEGIRPLNLFITCDRTRGGPHVLGRWWPPCTFGPVWPDAQSAFGWVS